MSEQVIKKCAACRAEKPVKEMNTCMHAQMHYYVCDSKCMNDFYNPPKQLSELEQIKADYATLQAERERLQEQLEVAKSDELNAAVWAETESIRHELWGAQRELSDLKVVPEWVEVRCDICGGTGAADSGGIQPWGEAIYVDCECIAKQEQFAGKLGALKRAAKGACSYSEEDWFRPENLWSCMEKDDAAFVSAASPFALLALIAAHERISATLSAVTTERDALRAELAAIKAQEPVAFYWQDISCPDLRKHGPFFGWPSESALRNVDGVAITVPLYTLPTINQQLTVKDPDQ